MAFSEFSHLKKPNPFSEALANVANIAIVTLSRGRAHLVRETNCHPLACLDDLEDVTGLSQLVTSRWHIAKVPQPEQPLPTV